MTDKDYRRMEGILYNYKGIQAKINNLILEIHYIEKNYRGCGAITYEEKTGQTNRFNSPVENEVMNKDEVLNRLKMELEPKKLIIEKIDNALGALGDKEKEIILTRYINGQGKISWPTVAEMTYLSESRCYQIKDDAIKKLIPIVFVNNCSNAIEKL